ncbi:Ribonuclease h protein [Thalictrum thalictroides]|uniref:Ribonuclease h protein n=1 Tax=Thalictrum thalictroides TaxID=46969 RepID=A0A7J6WXC3_THATH|nr:Ribonuclease h protein [Thalictrum thalictroides]
MTMVCHKGGINSITDAQQCLMGSPPSLDKLRSLTLLTSPDNPDTLVWKDSPNGSFNMKTAYLSVVNPQEDNYDEDSRHWRKLWKGKGPARWNSFLWILRHDRLMTNWGKFVRNIIDDGGCSICGATADTSLHAIRDCPENLKIWQQIVRPEAWHKFKSLSLKEWVDWNLSKDWISTWDSIEWRILLLRRICCGDGGMTNSMPRITLL